MPTTPTEGIRCDGCDNPRRVRVYRVRYHGERFWDTVRYCPDCADLARIGWSGEIAEIREREERSNVDGK